MLKLNLKLCKPYRSFHTLSKESCVVSGIQPTGLFHIGNLFGAFNQWIQLQNQTERVIYFIADLHAITTYQNPSTLRSNILEAIASLIACGIDPQKSIVFQQSQVKEHCELAWILGCMTTLSKLDYLPVWKQTDSNKTSQTLGIYAYPVLQSADILAYKATHVPIGEDQSYHLHLTQHLVQKFNNTYQKTFPIPEPIFGKIARLKSLKDPSKKMSKSDVNDKSRINLTDTADEIRQKIKKALTDTLTNRIIVGNLPSSDGSEAEQRPGLENLKDIYMALKNGTSSSNIDEPIEFRSIQEFKDCLTELLIAHLKPIRESILALRKEPQYLEQILKDGSDKARSIAAKTIINVKNVIGL